MDVKYNILWISRFGSWTLPLAERIAKYCNLCIIVPSENGTKQEIQNGITFFYCGISILEQSKSALSDRVANKYLEIINQWKPQLIHIHGTENNFAQIQKYVPDIPVIVSIQGILSGCEPYINNYIKRRDIKPHTSLKNILGRGGYMGLQKTCDIGRKNFETEILRTSRYFFCRTNWDKAWITFHNKNAMIFHGEEILRDPFYSHSGQWKHEACIPHRIFMPSGFNPIKGLHLAIKSIALLKPFYPDIKLTVPGLPLHIFKYSRIKSKLCGEEYVNYVKHLVSINGLENHVEFLPRLNAEEMAKEMLKANVFLSPSSIDNSPNAVGEATMIGVPIVVTPVGGIPSFLRDEDSCLLAAAGDEYIMAYQIKRVFDDAPLAAKLSEGAFKVALKRHNKEVATMQYLDAYKQIINQNKES